MLIKNIIYKIIKRIKDYSFHYFSSHARYQCPVCLGEYDILSEELLGQLNHWRAYAERLEIKIQKLEKKIIKLSKK